LGGWVGILVLWYQATLTRDALEITKQSVNIVISKERARIEVTPLTITIEDSKEDFEPPIREMTYRVDCRGTTQATILENRVHAEISKTKEPLHPEKYGSMLLPGTIFPQEKGIEKVRFLDGDEKSFDALPDEGLEDGRLFLNVWGLIRYRDIFSDDAWVYRFRYRWASYGQDQGGYWEAVGKPEENSETKEH